MSKSPEMRYNEHRNRQNWSKHSRIPTHCHRSDFNHTMSHSNSFPDNRNALTSDVLYENKGLRVPRLNTSLRDVQDLLTDSSPQAPISTQDYALPLKLRGQMV